MDPLAERVRRTIRRHALIPGGSRILVAVSGGADSVALADLLVRIAPAERFEVAAIAHLNHQLRSTASDEDETFCRELAASLGVAFDAERADVAARARAARVSIEVAAREARYEFLERAADRAAATRIAVGHTRDDQAETFLLRLLRGAGPRGLAGVYPRIGRIVRPLLDVTREELRRDLAARHLAFREDATNLDRSIPRNRVRHDVIPLLEERFSASVVSVLAREAAIARDDEAYLAEQAASAARTALRLDGDRVEIDVGALLAEPPALSRRILLRALARHAGGRAVGFSHADALLALASGREQGSTRDLPGQRAALVGRTLILTPRRADNLIDRSIMDRSRSVLPVPGEVVFPPAGCRVAAEVAPVVPGQLGLGWLDKVRGDLAIVDAATLPAALAVRSRRPGDRFRPLGLGGHKKLQDYFVDRKVPRHDRDRIPIVVDDRDRIVWVAGLGIAEDFRVTGQTTSVVILKVAESGAGA